MRAFGLILFTALILTLPGALVLASSPSGDRGLVIVVAPPWVDLDQLVARSGGRIVGVERARLAVAATADDMAPFRDALRANGALTLIDASRVASFCGV